MAKLVSMTTSTGETSGMGAQRTDRRLRETSLRKLPRAELQKLAKESGMKANVKSEQIIQNLLKLEHPKKNARYIMLSPGITVL